MSQTTTNSSLISEPQSSSHSMLSSLSPTLSPEFEESLKQKKRCSNTNNEENILYPSLHWKYKAQQIIEILFKDCKSLPFRCAVDEKRDNAPNYYQTIDEPMDLGKLTLLIKNDEISSPKQFVSHLMLIWNNALVYNAASLEIYADAGKLKTLSNKLIREYWRNEYKTLYESRRKSRRIRQNKIANVRYCKDTSYPIRECLECGKCSATLTFMCGFNIKCRYMNAIKCIECDISINDTKICYYHCMDGCSSTTGHHSLFLCEFCAEKHFDSKQIKIKINNTKCIAFRGLFLDLSAMQKNDNELDVWFEAIIMKQDANRVFYELIFSSETNKRWITEAHIIDAENRIFEVVKTRKWTDFTKGVLSEDGLSLRFIDKEEPDNCDPNIFTKVQVECEKCGEQCMFMTHCMLPSNDPSMDTIYCDTHERIYKEMEKYTNPTQACLCFKRTTFHNTIYHMRCYFSCTYCNEFDQCEVCTLIHYEQKFRQKMQNIYKMYDENISSEPPRKKQRVMSKCIAKKQQITNVVNQQNTICVDQKQSDWRYEKLHKEYIEEKRRNQQLTNDMGIIKNELEIAVIQKDKSQQKCNKIEVQLQNIQSQKDEYLHKFHQLKQQMANVLAEFE